MFTGLIYKKLTHYVTRYQQAHPDVRLIIIVGSTNKAITRQAVGTVLAQGKRVRLREHLAKTPLATPLAILGIAMPKNPANPFAWCNVFRAARRRIHEAPDVDAIVQELTIRQPGDMKEFARYLHPSIAIITSVAAERMDVFGTMDAVAEEYLSVGDMCDFIIVNRDAVDSKYADYERNVNLTTYGSTDMAEYWVEAEDIYGPHGTPIEINGPEYSEPLVTKTQLVGTSSLHAVLAGAIVGTKLGVDGEAITNGVAAIRTFPGRMNPLNGIGQTLILDDTYRATPNGAIAGLQTLYEFDTAPQRIAVMSAMPDLADSSKVEHERVAELLNPDLLAWVVLVGKDAEEYMAPVARKQGCQVKVCRDAIDAGQFVRSVTEQGAAILVEGSSPETYLEETTKILCDVSEETKLVRQGVEWRAIKDQVFSRFE